MTSDASYLAPRVGVGIEVVATSTTVGLSKGKSPFRASANLDHLSFAYSTAAAV